MPVYNQKVYGPYGVMSNRLGQTSQTGVATWELENRFGSLKRPKPTGRNLIFSATNHTKWTRRMVRTPLSYSWDKTILWTDFQYSGTFFPNQERDAWEREAIIKLRMKFKGETWNAATFVGELPETLKYFQSLGLGIVKSYRDVKKGNLRKALRRLKRLSKGKTRPSTPRRYPLGGTAGKWLEWRYAVQPLMYDLEDQLAYLMESGLEPEIKRLVAGVKCSYTKKTPDTVATYQGDVIVGAYISKSTDASAWQRLGLINPVAALWELVPLSFVVDWFIPVGDLLGQLDASVGIDVKATWLTHRYVYREIRPQVKTAHQNGTVTQAGYDYNDKTYTRRYPVDVTRLVIPPYKPSINVLRFFDSLALMRSIMLSRRS